MGKVRYMRKNLCISFFFRIFVRYTKNMAKASYSQYSQWSHCPLQYKFNYVDKLGIYASSIHLIFGTSMHEVIQTFLETMYNTSKKAAMAMDLEALLLERLVANFKIEKDKMKGEIPCTKLELEEFYGDGSKILQYFVNKISKFYSKSGFELVGIEIPIEVEIKNGVFFISYLDVVMRDKISDTIIIIDIKTSTKGWSSYEKNDKVKTSQMLIYKKFYSEKFGIPLDKIKVEYHILKRKIPTNSEFPIPRISKFVPPSGKPSINKAWAGFMEFVDTVFDENGNRRTTGYPAHPSKLCDWCDFKGNPCDKWK